MGFGGIVLLVLTLVCWGVSLFYLIVAWGPRETGDGVVGQGYVALVAMFFAALTWLWLGGLLLKTGKQGLIPQKTAVIAAVLYIVYGVGLAAGFFVMDSDPQSWRVFAPAAVAPILAFYVVALYQPSLRPAFSGTRATVAIWGAVLILTGPAWPPFIEKLMRDQLRKSERAQWQAEREVAERNRPANLEKLAAMKPTEPLTNWYPLLDEASGVRPEAIEALRRLERRQADIEQMLSDGVIQAMDLLPYLDLKATPQLCTISRAFLVRVANDWRVRDPKFPTPYEAESYAVQVLPGIRWLVENGCDCNEGIVALEASVSTHTKSPARKYVLATLADLRAKR